MLLPGSQFGDLLLEVGHRGEGAVDAREAQVGDFVELPEGPQDGQPHLVARNLRRTGGADGVLDLLSQQLQLVLVDRPTLAGPSHTGDDLGPVERFAHATALDDGQHGLLDRGEPAPARGAGAAATGGRPLVGLPRVDDPAVGVVAERAAHRGVPPPEMSAASVGPSVDPPGDIRWMTRGEPEDRPVDRLTTL